MEGDQVKLKEEVQVHRLCHTYLVILSQNVLEKNVSSDYVFSHYPGDVTGFPWTPKC